MPPAVTSTAKPAATSAASSAAASTSSAIKPVAADARVAFVFPGQGSQELGMTKEELAIPAVKALYDEAEEVLGYDLRKVVIEGPESKLNSTEFCQPAMFVAGLAAVEKLRAADPAAIEKCEAAAGLSLGEYTALVFAGAMAFKDALRIVKIRAEAMQRAGEVEPGTMLSVIGIPDAALTDMCARASASSKKTAIIANYLAPDIRVVSGHTEAVKAVAQEATPKAVKVSFLDVSGAFHSPLMGSATDALRGALSTVSLSLPTRVSVYANTTGRKYRSVEEIREQLVLQVCEAVQWENSLREMLRDGATAFYELGPKRQIKSMMRKIDAKAFKDMANVTV